MRRKGLLFSAIALLLSCVARSEEATGAVGAGESGVESGAFVYYVDCVNGDDERSGLSLSDAKKTIDAAIAVLDASYEGMEGELPLGTIWLARGTNELNTAVETRPITNPIAIRSISGKPVDTIINLASTSGSMARHFELRNERAVVSGVTFRGGKAASYVSQYGYTGRGAQLYNTAGLVTNCVFEAFNGSLSRSSGICLYGTAKMVDSVVRHGNISFSNVDSTSMASVLLGENATLSHCVITNCIFNGGNTSYQTTAVKIISSGSSGGVVVRNCLIANNKQKNSSSIRNGVGLAMSGGLVENCTIVNNENASAGVGNGIYATGGKIRNTIISGNTSLAISNVECSSGVLSRATYCCSKELTTGEGNTTFDPRFVCPGSDYGLLPISSCRDAALTLDWMAQDGDERSGACDLDGRARIVGSAPDMGCYEGATMEGLPLSAVFDVSTISIGERAPVDVTFSTTVIGDTDGLTMTWDFGDGSELLTTTEFSVVHKYMAVGKYSPKLFVENGIGENAEFEVENGVVIIPSKVYVSKTGGNVWPFDTWESAANEIQDAVDLLPDEIEVAPGTYVAPDNGIAIPTAIYLYSSNGTNDTFITSRGANTSSRLVWLQHSDAIVDGFSLINSAGKSNGYVYFALIKSGKIINSFFGGAKSTERGVMVSISNGMVSNCVINARNENFMNGNGTTCGVFVGENGLLTHCEVYGYNYPKNTDYQIGLNSSVCLNHATAVVRNCYIHDSTASRSYGGGIRSAAGLIENCTVTRCSGTLGGGVYINDSSKTTIRNCIFYGNTSLKADGTGRDDFYAANNNKVFYSCASDLTDGENGNLSCNPKFSRDGFSLMAKSPCRNAGENQPWMFEELAGDISGVKRILGGTVDMGAFECQRPLPSLLFLK